MGNFNGVPALANLNADNAAQIFASLDRKQAGYLTLRELMSAASSGLVMPQSLPALYFFDEGKDGRITSDEFIALVSFCQREKDKAQEDLLRDRAFRTLIREASAAGVSGCSVLGRDSFRRFSSHSNVKTIFSRHATDMKENDASSQQSQQKPNEDQVGDLRTCHSEGQSYLHVNSFSGAAFYDSDDDTDTDHHSSEMNGSQHCENVVNSLSTLSSQASHRTDMVQPVQPGYLLVSPRREIDETTVVGPSFPHEELETPNADSHVAAHDAVTGSETLREAQTVDGAKQSIDQPPKFRESSEVDLSSESMARSIGVIGSTAHETSVQDSSDDSSSEDERSERLENSESGQASSAASADSIPWNGIAGVDSRNEVLEPLDAQSCTAVDAAVIERIVKSNIHKLADMLHREGSRKQFMQWLWKLIDFDRNSMVTLEELRVFLEALREDGIDLGELAFYKEPGVPLEECIINEFDTAHSGVLSMDEFMVLADLVTREYEFWENRHLDRTGDYELGRTIGRGSSCVVRTAVHTETHEKYAVKIIRKGKCADMNFIDREIQALTATRHANIVALEEVLESDENVFLVIELCGGGALCEVLRLYPDERMPEEVARFHMRQIFDALAYCHSNGICHRDFRLDNVLLDNRGIVKIADFGHSKMYTAGWDFHSTMLVGSVHNLSPEQILGQVYSGEKIDIWSAGVAMFTLLVGHPPFYDQDTVTLLQNITSGSFEVPGFVSKEATDLIHCMIRVQPNERVPLVQLLQHPWFYAGDSYGPNMDVYTIPVHSFYRQRPDLAEMILAGTIHEHNLHFHLADKLNPKCAPDDLRGQNWCLKCLSPQMDMRFSVSLFTVEPKKIERSNSQMSSTLGCLPDMSQHQLDGHRSRSLKTLALLRLEGSAASWDLQSAISEDESAPRGLCLRATTPSGLVKEDKLTKLSPTEQYDVKKGKPDVVSSTSMHFAHKRSKSLDGGELIKSVKQQSRSESIRLHRSSGVDDAFPYHMVIPKMEMPEATRLFDSNYQIAAAVAASKVFPFSFGRLLPRSHTIDTVSNYAKIDGDIAEQPSSGVPNVSIARSLAQHPLKAHNSQVARQFASGNVLVGSPSNPGTSTSSKGVECNVVSRFEATSEEEHDGRVACGGHLDGQPFIEVRLHSGETGLFFRICHKLKTICDTKLAAAAEAHMHRSNSRRSASASILAFRKKASAESVERR